MSKELRNLLGETGTQLVRRGLSLLQTQLYNQLEGLAEERVAADRLRHTFNEIQEVSELLTELTR